MAARCRHWRRCQSSPGEVDVPSGSAPWSGFTIEPGYPALLAHIDAPPPAVYVKGDIQLLSRPMIAIVGSRQASAAGLTLARRFAADLGRRGFVTVSGLARGIDAAVHDASLQTGTVAVLAGGIDFVYPPENARLQEMVAETGCLATEMPPGFEPRAKDFPRRNRLVAGMSFGVVVIEELNSSRAQRMSSRFLLLSSLE